MWNLSLCLRLLLGAVGCYSLPCSFRRPMSDHILFTHIQSLASIGNIGVDCLFVKKPQSESLAHQSASSNCASEHLHKYCAMTALQLEGDP